MSPPHGLCGGLRSKKHAWVQTSYQWFPALASAHRRPQNNSAQVVFVANFCFVFLGTSGGVRCIPACLDHWLLLWHCTATLLLFKPALGSWSRFYCLVSGPSSISAKPEWVTWHLFASLLHRSWFSAAALSTGTTWPRTRGKGERFGTRCCPAADRFWEVVISAINMLASSS